MFGVNRCFVVTFELLKNSRDFIVLILGNCEMFFLEVIQL